MAEQPEPLEDVLSDVLDARFAGVHTALPGRVEKYYSDTQTADVLPLIKAPRVDESGNLLFSSFPVLPRIPVIHPRGGGFFVHFPLAVGDFVMLVFQEASIDQWRAKDGRETEPLDLRRHGLGNAVAYPGLYPTSQTVPAHATNLVVGHEDGQQIHIQPGAAGQIRLGSGTEESLVALAELVDDYISRLDSVFRNWVTVPNDGGAALKTAYTGEFSSAPDSVAATKVTAL